MSYVFSLVYNAKCVFGALKRITRIAVRIHIARRVLCRLDPTEEELEDTKLACDRLWDLDVNRLTPEVSRDGIYPIDPLSQGSLPRVRDHFQQKEFIRAPVATGRQRESIKLTAVRGRYS